MSTPQTDAFWQKQQEVFENFAELLVDDFHQADLLIQDETNFDHVTTFNRCYNLYTEFVADNIFWQQEQYLTGKLIYT